MNELNIKKGETYGWRDEAGEHVGVVQWTGYDVACLRTQRGLKAYVPKTQLRRQLSAVVVAGSSSFGELENQRALGARTEHQPVEKLSVHPPFRTEDLSQLARRGQDGKVTLESANEIIQQVWQDPSQTVPVDSQAAKQDNGKIRWSLLLKHVPHALEECIRVREYGLKKYGESESWKRVKPERYLEAALRHIMCAVQGERVNEADGGVNHVAQAVTDLLFLLELEHGKEKK